MSRSQVNRAIYYRLPCSGNLVYNSIRMQKKEEQMTAKVIKVTEGWTGPGSRDTLIERLQPKDDGLHMDVGKRGMYEWWYFDAHLETGHKIVVFFHASNPNPGLEGKTGVEIVLLRPDGKRTQKFIAYRRSNLPQPEINPMSGLARTR